MRKRTARTLRFRQLGRRQARRRKNREQAINHPAPTPTPQSRPLGACDLVL